MPLRNVTKYKRVEEVQISGAACDKCGFEHDNGHLNEGDLHVINLYGGYGHTFPGDLDHLQIVICSTCLRQWVGTFKTPPRPRL